jgi:hypothetical protein
MEGKETMAEDPIKLFSSRAERFPKPDDSQTLREAIEKGIEQVPVFGPITTFVTSRFWAPSASARLEEWLKELADDFDRHCETCTVENLIKNEAFISASIQVARIVVATHQEEKRKYLRNALLNIALGNGLDEIKQQIFLNAIEAFSPAHVKALNIIWRNGKVPWDQHRVPMGQRNYGAAIEIVVPELRGQANVTAAVLADLRVRGFSNVAGPELLFPQGGIITGFGVEFLNFVLSPEDLPK